MGQWCTYVITVTLFAAFVALQARAGEKKLAPGRIVKQRSLASSALYILFIQVAKSQLSYFVSEHLGSGQE
jgi:hypothetical protein